MGSPPRGGEGGGNHQLSSIRSCVTGSSFTYEGVGTWFLASRYHPFNRVHTSIGRGGFRAGGPQHPPLRLFLAMPSRKSGCPWLSDWGGTAAVSPYWNISSWRRFGIWMIRSLEISTYSEGSSVGVSVVSLYVAPWRGHLPLCYVLSPEASVGSSAGSRGIVFLGGGGCTDIPGPCNGQSYGRGTWLRLSIIYAGR